MKISYHANFLKQYKKLTNAQRKRFQQRKNLFRKDEFNIIVNNHALKGKYEGFRSINVTGDIRAIFKRIGDQTYFVAIGSHNKLYSS